jgi:sugar lactone lactonase YvrE
MTRTIAVDCIVRTENLLGEGTVWCNRRRVLWWVDVLSAQVHEWRASDGSHKIHTFPFRRIGSLALRGLGGLILATEQGLFSWDPSSGACDFLVAPAPMRSVHRLNDGRCDRAGRLWVGSMHDSEFTPEGSLFRVDPELRVSQVIHNITVPNSIAFSPDDKTFYFADTRQYAIWAYDFDLIDGHLTNRRTFVTFEKPARPDGSCIDATGCLWNAAYAGGRLIRYTPSGKIDRVIELPVSHPTCCCLGGASLDMLFITSARFPLTGEQLLSEPLAGSILVLQPGVQGLPEPEFAG